MMAAGRERKLLYHYEGQVYPSKVHLFAVAKKKGETLAPIAFSELPAKATSGRVFLGEWEENVEGCPRAGLFVSGMKIDPKTDLLAPPKVIPQLPNNFFQNMLSSPAIAAFKVKKILKDPPDKGKEKTFFTSDLKNALLVLLHPDGEELAVQFFTPKRLKPSFWKFLKHITFWPTPVLEEPVHKEESRPRKKNLWQKINGWFKRRSPTQYFARVLRTIRAKIAPDLTMKIVKRRNERGEFVGITVDFPPPT